MKMTSLVTLVRNNTVMISALLAHPLDYMARVELFNIWTQEAAFDPYNVLLIEGPRVPSTPVDNISPYIIFMIGCLLKFTAAKSLRNFRTTLWFWTMVTATVLDRFSPPVAVLFTRIALWNFVADTLNHQYNTRLRLPLVVIVSGCFQMSFYYSSVIYFILIALTVSSVFFIDNNDMSCDSTLSCDSTPPCSPPRLRRSARLNGNSVQYL